MKTIMKKVIFLDIDGVLNSVIYDRYLRYRLVMGEDEDSNLRLSFHN